MRILKGLMSILYTFGDDVLAVAGLAVICRATFMLSEVAGWYVIGVILVLLGVIWSKNVPKPP